jgi:hypothetical protein
MFALGPAERFGYLIYPLGLAGWLWLTRRAERDGQASEPALGRRMPTQEGST